MVTPVITVVEVPVEITTDTEEVGDGLLPPEPPEPVGPAALVAPEPVGKGAALLELPVVGYGGLAALELTAPVPLTGEVSDALERDEESEPVPLGMAEATEVLLVVGYGADAELAVGLLPDAVEPVPTGAVPLGKAAELMLEAVGLFPEDAEMEPVPMGAVPLGSTVVLLDVG